jgi:hypothetical protein
MHRLALVVVFASSLAAADEVAPPAATRPAPRPANGPKVGGLKDPFGEMQPSQPPAPPPPPRIVVAPEIAKLGKQVAGSYKCKGVQMRGDGSSTPLAASVTIKLDLDNAWIVVTLAETKAGGVKFEDYRTYDATSKQWTRIQLASTSAHVIAQSLGERDGKWTWEGNAIAPSGSTQVRDYEQITGKDIKVWGEAMLGGSWQKMYEATCKR